MHKNYTLVEKLHLIKKDRVEGLNKSKIWLWNLAWMVARMGWDARAGAGTGGLAKTVEPVQDSWVSGVRCGSGSEPGPGRRWVFKRSNTTGTPSQSRIRNEIIFSNILLEDAMQTHPPVLELTCFHCTRVLLISTWRINWQLNQTFSLRIMIQSSFTNFVLWHSSECLF